MQRLPLGLYQDSTTHPPLKASIFSKLHQLLGVAEQLRHILNLPQDERNAWTLEHQEHTKNMLKEFQEYVRLDLNQDDVDKEMVGLLTEYSRALQECTVIIHTLFPEFHLEG